MADKKVKLTTKQAKFVKGIAQGKTNTDSALEAYDTNSYETAAVIATENLKKPNIQDAIELARVKLNLTPERALKPIDDALNDDDLEMRLKGSDRALKLMGIANRDNSTINNFGQMVVQAKDKYAE
jgi:phage terminase small subunit